MAPAPCPQASRIEAMVLAVIQPNGTVIRNPSIHETSDVLDFSIVTDGYSTRATLGESSARMNSGNCDEISCCKSYLGKNNEVKMTSNLPECFFRCFVMTTFLTAYMCLGAAIFCAIEREHEKLQAAEMRQLWENFQKKHDIPQPVMDEFLQQHYESCENGDSKEEGSNVQWDYVSSLFFTGTILTTIGYGHSSPATLVGRVFTIFFAIGGIPFMLGLLNVVAEILLTALKIIKSKIKKRPNPDVNHYEVFVSALLWVIILLIFMTFIFKYQESTWSYEQSVYFSFITMTTIGFGDFVPAQVQVSNYSPSLIAREFFNLVVIFISVLVWYFLSQVSAQVLKVRIKALFRRLNLIYSKTRCVEVGMNNQTDEYYRDRGCVCSCTCGFNDQQHARSETSLDINNSVKSEVQSSKTELVNDNPNVSIVHLEHYQSHGNVDCAMSLSLSDASECDGPISLNDSLANQKVPPDYSSNEIPSIIITSVESPNLHESPPLSSPLLTHNDSYQPPAVQLTMERPDLPYDSGQGSSEITCPVKHPPTLSESSLSTNSSGVFSDCPGGTGHAPCENNHNNLAEDGHYTNGGFLPSPRITRSKSVEVCNGSFSEEKPLESDFIRSKSLCDLSSKSRNKVRLSTVSIDSRNANSTNGVKKNVGSFNIHTELFDNMMKS